ncbi:MULTISPECIES: hypothetical protein [Agrobacterium]|uniref:Uncharacterized protein n=1 Tax=Agrobacterium tumefaciens TaxID=358 RepID=A0AAF0GWV4_AGRTU|nr:MULTISPECIES: hypothetical protein [Agrobacterium]WGM59923.1 hypothetical protein CFBP5506_03475 [Agrobacterium tumefaciens]
MDEARGDHSIDDSEGGDQDAEPHARIDPAAGCGTEERLPALRGTSLNNKMRPAFEPHHKSNHFPMTPTLMAAKRIPRQPTPY